MTYSPIFDKNGQVNATDRTEALAQLIRYANVLSNNQPLGTGSADAVGQPGISDEAVSYTHLTLPTKRIV